MPSQAMVSGAEFHRMLPASSNTVSLTQLYKGTAVHRHALILAVSPEAIIIQPDQYPAYPLLDNTVLLRSRAFPGAISARITPLDTSPGAYQLSGITYGAWTDRRAVRVQPERPVFITLRLQRRNLRARLDDISASGIAILWNKTLDPSGVLKPGAKVMLDFQLKPDLQVNNLKGVIVYRFSIRPHLVKTGLQIFPSASQRTAIQTYVRCRQTEIQAELDKADCRLREPLPSEELFF